MTEENGFVTISLDEYRGLKRQSRLQLALQDAGVDNWQGYDYAMDQFRIWNEEDPDCEDNY